MVISHAGRVAVVSGRDINIVFSSIAGIYPTTVLPPSQRRGSLCHAWHSLGRHNVVGNIYESAIEEEAKRS